MTNSAQVPLRHTFPPSFPAVFRAIPGFMHTPFQPVAV